MLLLEDRRFYVYVYLDPTKPGKYKYEEYEFDHEPFYVGKGKDKRIIKSKYKNGSNTYKYNKIQKIKKQGFKIISLKYNKNLTEQEAFILEIDMIEIIGRKDKKIGPLTNLDDGGCGSSGAIRSEELKKHLSKINSGENHPNYGKHFSQELIDKLRKSHIGKKLSEEHKRKIGDSCRGDKSPMYGKHPSKETRKKQSIIRKERYTGKNHPMYGRHHSKEAKERMRYAKLGKHMGTQHHNSKAVIVENKYYGCMADALRDNNISKPTFYNRLKRNIPGYGYAKE